jgi:hypothetical protein
MPSRRSRSVAAAAATAVAVVGLLAAASWATTREDWDGGFPAGAVRLEVRGQMAGPSREPPSWCMVPTAAPARGIRSSARSA